MKSIAVALVAALLAGCVSTSKLGIFDGSYLISFGALAQVQAVVQQGPVVLRRAIRDAAESRLHDGVAVELKSEKTPADVMATIADVVAHSQNRLLAPDAEFERLHGVLVGARQDPKTAYAQAVAEYVTQADFACRQPLYAHYLDRRYAAEQEGRTPCPTAVPLLILDRYENPKVIWLDPGRVKSIHLLFAGKSGSAASRFGHVALRLVVCPEGEASTDSCDANLFEHVVLGFQAQVDEFSLDTFRALTGGYRAYLFANRFMDVYEQYAIGEFRDVYSLPLRLNDAQREFMLRALTDIHWRYAGDYSFFTRNCATLLQHSLRAAWPEYAADEKLADGFLRPDHFYEALRASPLAEGERLSSLPVAEHDGYYFPSTQKFYRQALQEVRAAMSTPYFADLDAYWKADPVERRQRRDADPQFLMRLAADRHLREAQIMLEELAVLRGERRLLQAGMAYLEKQDFVGRADHLLFRLDEEHALAFNDCLLAQVREITNPLRRLNGIPSAIDIDDSVNSSSACNSARQKDLLREAIGMIGDTESEQWKRLDEASTYLSESIVNLEALKRKLHLIQKDSSRSDYAGYESRAE